MATRMTSRDCEGQSELINGTMLRDDKKTVQIKSQSMLFVTFIPALPKKIFILNSCLACFLCLPWSYCLCKPVMTVVCVQGVLRGENMNAFVFFYYID